MLEMKNKILEMKNIYIFESLNLSTFVYYKGETLSLW